MPAFGTTSQKKLSECDAQLQSLFNKVVEDFDCSIIDGFREEIRQDEMFNSDPQRSQVKWPNGKHNSYPSMAVDVVPYPVDWNDTDRFYFFAGYVKGLAKCLGIDIRWGGDWDSDNQVGDESFKDLPHYELVLE